MYVREYFELDIKVNFMNMRTALIWLRNVGFCEQGNEHSDPLK